MAASVAEDAQTASRTTPSAALLLPLAFVVGAVTGLVLLALVFRFGRVVWGPEEAAERAGLPLLGHLRSPRRKNREQGSSEPAAAEAVLTRVGLDVMRQDPGRVLVVGAAREDVSPVVIGVATAIARTDLHVLVVDADLSHPPAHPLVDVLPDAGLSTLMEEGSSVADAILDTEIPSVSLVLPGPLTGETAAVSWSRVPAVLDDLEKFADIVVVRGPGVLAGPVASLIGMHVDLTLLVTRLGETTRGALTEASQQLAALPAACCGVVAVDGDVRSTKVLRVHPSWSARRRCRRGPGCLMPRPGRP